MGGVGPPGGRRQQLQKQQILSLTTRRCLSAITGTIVQLSISFYIPVVIIFVSHEVNDASGFFAIPPFQFSINAKII